MEDKIDWVKLVRKRNEARDFLASQIEASKSAITRDDYQFDDDILAPEKFYSGLDEEIDRVRKVMGNVE